MSFFHTKSVAQLHADSENSNLSKDLGVMDLTFLGVGGIIGAGIFVLTGIAAANTPVRLFLFLLPWQVSSVSSSVSLTVNSPP